MRFLDENELSYYNYLLVKMMLADKVDKEPGKGLSEHNLTDELLQKILNAGSGSFTESYNDLSNIPTLDTIPIKGALSKAALGIAAVSDIKTSLSQLTNDVDFQDENQVITLIQSALASYEAGWLKYKGGVLTYGDLPDDYADANAGWMWHVEDECKNYYWQCGVWKELSLDIDLSDYLKITDIEAITNAEIDTIVAG